MSTDDTTDITYDEQEATAGADPDPDAGADADPDADPDADADADADADEDADEDEKNKKSKKPWIQKYWWVLLIAGLVCVGVIVVLIIVLGDSTSSSSESKTSPNQSKATNQSTSTNQSTPNGTSSASKLYVMGGYKGSYELATKIEIFDGTTWTEGADMGTNYRHAAGCVVLNKKIYVIGGRDSARHVTNTVNVYDPATSKWSAKANLITNRENPGCVVYNGNIFVLGGYNGNYLVSVEKYDPNTDSWTEVGTLMEEQVSNAVVLNNKIYCVSSFVNIFDPSTNVSTQSSASINAEMGDFFGIRPCTAVCEGNLHLLSRYSNSQNFFDRHLKYNPLTDAWTLETKMLEYKWNMKSVYYKDSLYVIGGEKLNPTKDRWVTLSTVDKYDPVAKTWSNVTPGMSTARIHHCVAAV